MNKDPSVQNFNRYCDILPYEDTRVKLKGVDGKSSASEYVNANYVHSAL